MPTQNQLHNLAGKNTVEWTECFFPIRDCGDVTTGAYDQAESRAEGLINDVLSDDILREVDVFLQEIAQADPSKEISTGSLWGARHEKLIGCRIAAGLTFSETAEPDIWDQLAMGIDLDLPTDQAATEFVVSDLWRARLIDNEKKEGKTWFNQLHLGLIALEYEKFDLAENYLAAAQTLKSDWMAARAIAVTKARKGEIAAACAAYVKSLSFDDAPMDISVEYAEYLHETDQIDALCVFIDQLPDEASTFERLRILRARVALKNCDFETLEVLLDHEFATIREGEMILSELWSGLVVGRAEQASGGVLSNAAAKAVLDDQPIPFHLDFVMQREKRIART